ARHTTGHRRLDARALGELEPSLEGRFRDGLFYADEGHVEPRRVLPQLHARIAAAGGTIQFNSEAKADDLDGIAIDCRGLAARDKEKIAVNGLYRHGFLLAPALAELVLGYVERGVIDNEVMQCA